MLVCAGLLVASTAAAQETEYHLTGVIGSSSGKLFAVIEQGDGQQRLLSEGDAIGDGRVLAISAQTKTVRLRFPGRDITLGLDGSGLAEEQVEDYAIEEYGNTEALSLNSEKIERLAKLVREIDELGDKESLVRLKNILGLSEDARIVALNEQQYDSSRELLEALAQDLPEKMKYGSYLGSIAVSSDRGKERMYLMQENEPGVKNSQR
jgi:hypothetical protein